MRLIMFASFMLAAHGLLPDSGAADLTVLAALALAAIGAGRMIGARG